MPVPFYMSSLRLFSISYGCISSFLNFIVSVCLLFSGNHTGLISDVPSHRRYIVLLAIIILVQNLSRLTHKKTPHHWPFVRVSYRRPIFPSQKASNAVMACMVCLYHSISNLSVPFCVFLWRFVTHLKHKQICDLYFHHFIQCVVSYDSLVAIFTIISLLKF